MWWWWQGAGVEKGLDAGVLGFPPAPGYAALSSSVSVLASDFLICSMGTSVDLIPSFTDFSAAYLKSNLEFGGGPTAWLPHHQTAPGVLSQQTPSRAPAQAVEPQHRSKPRGLRFSPSPVTNVHPGPVPSAGRHRLASADSEVGAQVHSVPEDGRWSQRQATPHVNLDMSPSSLQSQRS